MLRLRTHWDGLLGALARNSILAFAPTCRPGARLDEVSSELDCRAAVKGSVVGTKQDDPCSAFVLAISALGMCTKRPEVSGDSETSPGLSHVTPT